MVRCRVANNRIKYFVWCSSKLFCAEKCNAVNIKECVYHSEYIIVQYSYAVGIKECSGVYHNEYRIVQCSSP